MHWDFLFLGESFAGSKYLLVLKDAATHYTDVVVYKSPTVEVAAQAVLDWYSRFGLPNVWVSDSASHFKKKVTRELCVRLKAEQRFIMAHCP